MSDATPTGQGEWIPQAEAARRLDCSVKTVERRRQAGELLGEKRGRHWFIWWPTDDQTGGDTRPDGADTQPPPPPLADAHVVYLRLKVEQHEETIRRLERELGEARGELRARLLLAGGERTDDRTATRQPWWRRVLDKWGR